MIYRPGGKRIIETSRFGPIQVSEERLISFREGILGFPEHNRYALIQTGKSSGFYWLQSTDKPDISFVIADPRLFVPDYLRDIYQIPQVQNCFRELEIRSPKKESQVFTIMNRRDVSITGNLQGPIITNIETREAKQVALRGKKYGLRHLFFKLPGELISEPEVGSSKNRRETPVLRYRSGEEAEAC